MAADMTASLSDKEKAVLAMATREAGMKLAAFRKVYPEKIVLIDVMRVIASKIGVVLSVDKSGGHGNTIYRLKAN
jgi:hypothetical protein